MIVTRIDAVTTMYGAGGEAVSVRCLARRGMLHSECEAVDYVRLGPGTQYALAGRDGAQSVWITLGGEGAVSNEKSALNDNSVLDGSAFDEESALTGGAVLLAPDDGPVVIRAGASGMELLCVRVLSESAARRLPPRRPEV